MSKMISVEKKTHHSHSYSISLPKIAIIHRKRTNRWFTDVKDVRDGKKKIFIKWIIFVQFLGINKV